MTDTFASFNRRVERFQRELTDDALGHELGKMAKGEAGKSAASDLTNSDFSGWRRGNPIKLDTRYDIVGPGRVLLKPTRPSAGPWTVAEIGRNQGNASGFAGPGINTRTGVTSRTKSGGIRKVRARKARRWNGYTSGKGTASKAVAEINKQAPRVVESRIGRAIRKSFR